MSTVTEKRPVGTEKAPPLIHRYWVPFGGLPRPGDVALCGWVKKQPSGAWPPSAGTLSCVVCAHLSEGLL